METGPYTSGEPGGVGLTATFSSGSSCPGSGPSAWEVRECHTESLPDVDLAHVTAVSTLGHPWAQASKGRAPA